MAGGRLTVRFSVTERAMLDALAESAGVDTGGLVREASLRAAREVAGDVSAGRVRIRRRSASVPVQAPAAESVQSPRPASVASERDLLAARTAALRGRS
jgi:hypothetical protein